MTPGGRRARELAAAIALAVAMMLALHPKVARADETSEAAALFASGNQHLQAAQRARGERRTRELEAAVADYRESLRRVRSRNVLFNAALASEQLGRRDDAFNFLSEYITVPGLSDTERAEATPRIEALRAQVAVLSIGSTPIGAEVWIDRRDLAARGRTPLELALPAGEHQLWLRAPGHRESEAHATATAGATSRVQIALEPDPVSLQILAPTEHRLLLDGQPIDAGATLQIPPGSHVVRLEIEGFSPMERRFEVLPGAPPMVIDLAPAVSGLARGDATLVVSSGVPAQVMIDGLLVGAGSRLEVPIARGDHDIRITAEGRAPWSARRTFALGDRTELRLDLAERSGGSLVAPRVLFGVLAALGLAAGATVTAMMVPAHDDATSACGSMQADCASLAATSNDWTLATDVTWAVTAALGVTALVLLLIDDGGGSGESRGEFVLAPVPLEGGAALAASVRFGGAL